MSGRSLEAYWGRHHPSCSGDNQDGQVPQERKML